MDEMQFEGMANSYPVICRWCKNKVVTYAASKVLMNMNDALDYDWACRNCYEKIQKGDL